MYSILEKQKDVRIQRIVRTVLLFCGSAPVCILLKGRLLVILNGSCIMVALKIDTCQCLIPWVIL